MTITQEQFVLEYLENNNNVDSCSNEFHSEFYKKFGGTTRTTVYETICVNKAMTVLYKMWKDEKLQRCKVTYDFKITQQLSWGYSYWLS